MIFHRTVAVKDEFIKDIEKILFNTIIVVQFIFFIYYAYSIYTNLLNLTFLIAYSSLLILSTISFIYYVTNYADKKNGKVKIVRKTFRIFKYTFNASMLVINLIEIIRYGGTDLAYGFIVFSSISLIIQITMEFIRGFVYQYINLFTIAITNDTQIINKVQSATDIKAQLYRFADSPFEVLSKSHKNVDKDLSDNEKLVEALGKLRKEKTSNKRKKRRQENTIKHKTKLKEHLHKVKTKINNKKSSFKNRS